MAKSKQLEQKRTLWAERIDQYQESNKSVAEWCKEQEIPEHQLRYWLSKSINQSVAKADSAPSRWMPLASSSQSGSTGITLRVGSIRLEIQRGFEPQVLVEVLNSLRELC